MVDSRESITAKLCSFARAYHSNFEKEKIFDDYLAFDFMGKEEYEEMGQLIQNDFNVSALDPQSDFDGSFVYPWLNRFISPIPLSRIAFAEKELRRFVKEKGKCQYVICGAGMDTFAFRNENPDIRIFELDHPDTQRYKLERVKKLEWTIPENVRYVPIDFSKDDMNRVLQEAGIDENMPTFVSILGVTYYLTLPVLEQTLKKVGGISEKESRVVFDFPDETTFDPHGIERVYGLTHITEKLGEPMQHGFRLPEIYLALWENGFQVEKYESPEMIQKNFFGERKDKQKAFENIHFILAKKTERYGE